MNIFRKVKNTALNRGLSIDQVAKKATEQGVKVSKSTIYTWDEKEPSADKIKAVADVLGVSVDYLLGNTDEMRPNTSVIPSEKSLDKSLDRSIAYDGTEITDHDRIIIKAMLNAYFENKDK